SFPSRYLDPHQDVRAISNHSPQPFRRGRAPHSPSLDYLVLDRGGDLGRIDEAHPALDRLTTSGDRQAHPWIVSPARHANRVGVIEQIDVPFGGGDEPRAGCALVPLLARAHQQFIGALERFTESRREHAGQNRPMTRVILLGLDGFPHRAVTAALTPRMWDLAQRGGRAPAGGITDLPSSTDPGFCSLLTGCKPASDGVRTTDWRFATLHEGARFEPAPIPTIFDAFRPAGIRTAAVFAVDRVLLCTGSADVR